MIIIIIIIIIFILILIFIIAIISIALIITILLICYIIVIITSAHTLFFGHLSHIFRTWAVHYVIILSPTYRSNVK